MFEVDTEELQIEMIRAGYKTILSFAEAAGINRNTVSDVIKGTAYPSSSVMAKMVRTLGIGSERAGRIFFKKKLTESVS